MNKNLYYLISLSGAYDSQSFWKTKDIEKMDTVLNKPALDCIYTDCTDILGSLYFCSDDARTELEKRLAYIPVNALHFIDSGDYHYVSLLFLQRINRPFSLLLFDHHSDCMESAFGGGLLTCGSWVLHALENLPIKRNKEILENIISLGMMDKYTKITTECECNKRSGKNESI